MKYKFFKIAIALICILFISLNSYALLLGIWSNSWVDTTAQIENIKLDDVSFVNSKGSAQINKIIFKYKYTVNGQVFKSSRIGYGIELNDEKAIEEFSKFKVGDKLVTFYNPYFPSFSVIIKGVHHFFSICMGIILSLCILVFSITSPYVKKMMS